jgi:dCMP deaminase
MLDISSKLRRYDALYMDIAKRVAQMSYAKRKQVGCVIVKDGNIISMGFNGMPAGMDNNCEHYDYSVSMDGDYVTNKEVSHAEENAIAKIARSSSSSDGATAYVTLAPCMHCAKLLNSAGIRRVVYGENYRQEGVEFLIERGVTVERSISVENLYESNVRSA